MAVISRRDNEDRGDRKYPFECDMFVKGNVADTESVKECFKQIYDKYGHIDVLVCTANGGGAGYGKGSQME